MIDRSTSVRAALRRQQRGFVLDPYRFAAAGPTDPNFASTVLLMHMDSTFGDSSAALRGTATVSGNAQVSAAQSKFGGASGLFDGAGDFLSYANSTDFNFGSADFTIELWMRATAGAGAKGLIDYRSAASGPLGYVLYSNMTTLLLQFTCYDAAGAGIGSLTTAGSTITAATWHHVAITRNGSSFTLWVDGVSKATFSSATALGSNTTTSFYVGQDQFTAGRDYDGYLDDLRITKGVCRYTAGFSPPTAAFPNS